MGYGTVSRLFHWVTVVLVAVMIPVGIVMIQDVPRSVQDPLFILHKGLGPFVLLVVLLRLLWRLWHPAPALPASVPALQQKVARLVHVALYFFLILQGVSGYVRVTTGGFPIETVAAAGHPAAVPEVGGSDPGRGADPRRLGGGADRADRDARGGGGLSRDRAAGRGFLDDVASGGEIAVSARNGSAFRVWNRYGIGMKSVGMICDSGGIWRCLGG